MIKIVFMMASLLAAGIVNAQVEIPAPEARTTKAIPLTTTTTTTTAIPLTTTASTTTTTSSSTPTEFEATSFFNATYLQYNQSSHLPPYAWFEGIEERLASELVISNAPSGLTHDIGDYIRIAYHQLTPGNNDKRMPLPGDPMEGQDELVTLSKPTMISLTEKGYAVVLLTRFNSQPSFVKFQSTHDEAFQRSIDSDVISVSAFVPQVHLQSVKNSNQSSNSGYLLKKRSVPLEYKLSIHNALVKELSSMGRQIRPNSLVHSCSFYDNDMSNWSEFGCGIIPDSDTSIRRCRCNHTTAFAVMLAMESFEVPQSLETAIEVLEGISVAALIVTIMAVLMFKQIFETDRFLTQLGICFSLVFLHAFFLVGSLAEKRNESVLCMTSAILAHFFTISSAVWMLNEAVMLWMKITKSALKFEGSLYKNRLLITGWLLPAVYVAACAIPGILTDSYLEKTVAQTLFGNSNQNSTSDFGQYTRCWVSTRNYMTLSVIIPLAVILIFNLGVLIAVVRVVQRLDGSARKLQLYNRNAKEVTWLLRHSKVVATFRATVILFPVLGIPWLLGFLVNVNGAEVVFIALHGIINGLQGLFILLIFCFKNKDLRAAAARKISLIEWSQS